VHTALRAPDVVKSAVARDLRQEIETFTRTPAAAITS